MRNQIYNTSIIIISILNIMRQFNPVHKKRSTRLEKYKYIITHKKNAMITQKK